VSLHKKRIQAIQAIVASTPAIASGPRHSIIQGEFSEVHRVRKVRQTTRRRLLEVLHSSRALDSALSVFVGHHKCPNKRPTLGSYLVSLMRHSVPGLQRLSQLEQKRYQATIVHVRNSYVHEAGRFPTTDTEVQTLVSEMHALIAAVSRL
jgi:hypothetical protein